MDLGDLKRLPPQKVWPDEARDFTPWLAKNIEKLGEAIGLELELTGKEVAVGDFSADLLARDLGSGDAVVIENQYGKTDHDHLGKVITYASGLDARAVIWLGESFREEHRQALEWLNQRTDERTLFFAVQIEVLQIDSSSPAINFKPLVFPNEWQKRGSRRAERTPSPRGEAYRNYFQRLIDTLREEHRFTNARAAQPQSWYAFASGFAGVTYGASFGLGKKARIEVYIDRGDEEENMGLFGGLRSSKDKIERDLGFGLEWEPLEDKRACRVAVYRPGSIDQDEAELDELQRWMIDHLLAMKNTFGPAIREFFAEK